MLPHFAPFHFALVHVNVRQLKLVSADALRPLLAAFWTVELVAHHIELSATKATTLTPRTNFNLQLHTLKIGITSHYFESELESVRIHSR
jgi:hypothetical protein